MLQGKYATTSCSSNVYKLERSNEIVLNTNDGEWTQSTRCAHCYIGTKMQLRLPRNPTGDITEPHSVGFPTVPRRHGSMQSGTHKQSTVVYEAEEEDRIIQIVKNSKLKQPNNLTNQPTNMDSVAY